ncbi:hypothetical protein PSPHG_CDS_0189 [Pseudomonas phage Psxphi15]
MGRIRVSIGNLLERYVECTHRPTEYTPMKRKLLGKLSSNLVKA